MKVIIADNAGFCEGVNKAFRTVMKELKKNEIVYILGNLVHNHFVINNLTRLGAVTIHKLSDIPEGIHATLVIAAHGVPPDIYAECKKKDISIVDTTCGWVKKAQLIAQKISQEGRQVIIIGDKDHTEVKGALGWSNSKGIVIEKVSDINKINLKPKSKIGVLAQTTQARDNFNNIIKSLTNKFKDINVYNTICGATAKRQNSCQLLANEADIIIIIGDKMSANTKRLFQICKVNNNKTHWVQSAKGLKKEWFKGAKITGITAGASTPDWIIKEVVDAIKKY